MDISEERPDSHLPDPIADTEKIEENSGRRARLSVSPLRNSLARLWRDWRTRACVGVLGFFVLLSLAGPPIYQHIGGLYTSPLDGHVYGPNVYHTYYHEELTRQDELPSSQYWLGTDEIGRDMLARLMQGLLVSIGLAVAVAIVDFLLGVSIGVLAGYYGGFLDQFLARFTDLNLAFPTLLFLIMLAGIYGEGADAFFDKYIPWLGGAGGGRIAIIFASLALFVWPGTARLARGQTIQLKTEQFVDAARASGTTSLGVIMRHIVPNLLSVVIVSVTLDMAGTIEGEAGISLLGLGIQPPGSSLGLMIASATPNITVYPYEILLPSAVLTILVLAFSFLGDAIQDAFSPQQV